MSVRNETLFCKQARVRAGLLFAALLLVLSPTRAQPDTVDRLSPREFARCLVWNTVKTFRPNSLYAYYTLDYRALGEGATANVFPGTMPREVSPRILDAMKKAGFPVRPGGGIAVKVPKMLESAAREAKIMRKLAQVDPERLFQRGFYDEQRGVLVMPRDPNAVTLYELLFNRKRRLTTEEAQNIFDQLVRAQRELKKAGLVHSDLKPLNILINPLTMKITIIDFGSTARVGRYPNNSRERLGTVGFSSPEVLNDEPAAFVDDRYSIMLIKTILEEAVTP